MKMGFIIMTPGIPIPEARRDEPEMVLIDTVTRHSKNC
jgi:hypothetical protein